MEDNTLLLKKYTNRRLYEKEKSIYVTLDYVTDIIRHGRKIKVTDAKTGEDVTAAILTQIVLEEARKKKYLLPTPLLYLIIQYGENVLTDFFEKYLEQTIKNYFYSTIRLTINSKSGLSTVRVTPKLIPRL